MDKIPAAGIGIELRRRQRRFFESRFLLCEKITPTGFEMRARVSAVDLDCSVFALGRIDLHRDVFAVREIDFNAHRFASMALARNSGILLSVAIDLDSRPLVAP